MEESTFQALKYLAEVRWPKTKGELIEYLKDKGAPENLIMTLEELEVDEDTEFYDIKEMWPDMPQLTDYFHEEED